MKPLRNDDASYGYKISYETKRYYYPFGGGNNVNKSKLVATSALAVAVAVPFKPLTTAEIKQVQSVTDYVNMTYGEPQVAAVTDYLNKNYSAEA